MGQLQLRKVTTAQIAEEIASDAYVLVTQQIETDESSREQEGSEELVRIPFSAFAASLGCDLDFDEETEMLYLVNAAGQRIGLGAPVVAGINGIQLYTEIDDTGTQYLIMADQDGNELARTEFTVTGTGGSTSYVCRLINGMSGTKLSYPSGQACVLNYEFYEFYGAEQTSVGANAEIFVKTGTGDYELKRSVAIQQGSNSVPVTPYLQTGTNYVKLQVTAGESGTVKVLVFTINVVDISLTSSFDATQAYSASISFPYRVTGRNIGKTMYFKVDGNEYANVDIGTAHNIQLTQTINLASYGHGDHVLEAYFITTDGARSPSLIYDIMFDTGGANPIISSTFEETEVAYGELIQVQYVVHTHGSDYTAEVDLDIYTKDENNNISYFQQSALANVVNDALQSWNITEYPSSGTVYLKITAKDAGGTHTVSKTFSLTVQENTGDRDLSGVSTRLIAAYSASGRSNSDANKTSMNAAYTSIDEVTTNIIGALTGFNWRSNGWLADADGFPVLRVSGGAEVELSLPFFASSWTDSASHTINLAGTPTAVGRTFEVAFKTAGVTDESKPIITVWDNTNGIGVKVFPSYAYLLSSTMSITTDADGNILNKNAIPYVPFSSQAGKVRLTFVIEEIGHYVELEDNNTNKQLIRIYVNGQLAKALAYTSDTFTTSAAMPKLTAESCILDVYSMRFYDYALTDADVLKNYIADLPSLAERIQLYDKNDICDDNGAISFAAAALQYPCMILTGQLSQYKGNKVKIGCQLIRPDGSVEDGYYVDWNFMEQLDGSYGNVNNVQGTSSQYYIKKNYKITFYELVDGVFKKAKVRIFPGRVAVNTICIKADYMSPDSANTGNANYWQTVCPEPTPPQNADASIQTAVMGYPILLFQRDTASQTPKFIGRYNLNNDKSNSEAFGLKNADDDGNVTKCQKWEYCDNSEDICNFQTDQLRALRTDSGGQYYEAWEDALESCYPDQGDLEDDGLRPKLEFIQMAYTWIVQRANFLDASTEAGTGGTYNGVSYSTEYDLKLAIFRREFSAHFNLVHTLWYFIANEVPLLVDNFAKNMFMTSFDVTRQHVVDTNGNSVNIEDITVNGVVNISTIDWENSTFAIWYPTLYDLDSCLGADNNGYDQFPYYKEMFDQYNGGYVVNGHGSLFWQLVYAAFFPELKSLYCRLRDSDQTLSPALYMQALIDNLTNTLPIVAVNADERFKYIEAYEGGYYDGGQDAWVYTLSFLYLAKGTMESYHRDFITKRFAMLDSKYLSDAYTQDYMTVRINRVGSSTPAQLAFNVSPCQAMYCYTEWGNSGSYIGAKCLEGNTVEMKPASAGNWYDIVLSIYGASHIKSLGDLSILYPSKPINLARCVNLQELLLGSSADGYENSVLDSIADVSYLTMLKKLNICNCTALSGTVDLSNCDLIEEVYASGSAISAIVLPQGGYLKKLSLPATVTALNVVGHTNLTDFSMDSYNNLLRLHVENTPSIDTAAILAARGTNLTRIRLVGVNWTLASDTVLRILADDSMASKAIDANGNAVDSTATWPTVTGTVTISRIQGSLLAKLNEKYPGLTINYTTKYHVVKFYNEGTLVSTQEIDDNGAATTPDTPTKAATTQYVYSFSGWSATYSTVTADMTINANFASSLQQYNIKFWDDSEHTTELASVSNVTYGATYTYPEDEPTKTGYVLCGWQDAAGHQYEYPTQIPDASAAIDANGAPQTIHLFPIWSAVTFPSSTKDFAALTPGERLWAAIAIQKTAGGGTYTVDNVSYDVNWYSGTSSYIIYNQAHTVSVTIAIGDTKKWTLYNGETLTQQVIDFNHDYSDSAETKKLGITYAMQNLLTSVRQMNPSYKHAFNYKFGNEDPIVSDNNNHSSTTDAALTHSHVASAAEVAAGFVDITVLGPTFLSMIKVTHSDDTTKTWFLDSRGYYYGTDQDTVSGCSWYKSDTDTDADNPFYKIGKILQSLNCDIVNWQGSIGLNGWHDTDYQWANLINQNVTLTDFGGLKINATGNDTLNTSANNPFNGTGKARVTFCKCGANDYAYNNFTEVSEGTVISVPVVDGDTVTVVAYGQSRNWGGFANSALAAWMNGDFLKQLPFGLRNTIVDAYKKCNVGNRSYAVTGSKYTLWCLSNAEVGGYTSNHPYMDAGSKYPIFTNDASRIKRREDGAGAVYSWWERDPFVHYSSYFYFVYASGTPYSSSTAGNSYGVCAGFTSGEE